MKKTIIILTIILFLQINSILQASPNTDLLKLKSVESIEKALAEGADINCRTEAGNTPLLKVLSRSNKYTHLNENHLNFVKVLIGNGAKIYLKNENGQSAKNSSYYKDIKSLIKNNKILLKAVNRGNFKKINKLFKNKPYPDLRNKYGETLLIIASRKGYYKIVKLLLKYNAGLNKTDYKNQTAELAARKYKRRNILKILKKARLTRESVSFAENGNTNKAIINIKSGADINYRNVHEQSVLDIAVITENIKLLKYLFKYKIKFRNTNKNYNNAFINAVLLGKTDIVKMFINAEIGMDLYKNTLLEKALKTNHIKIVELLIKNEKIKNYYKALPWSAVHGSVSLTDLILKRCKNKKNWHKEGFKALHIAAKNGNNNIALKLFKAGLKIDNKQLEKVLWDAAFQGNYQIVKILFKNGFKLKNNFITRKSLTDSIKEGYYAVNKQYFLYTKNQNINKPDAWGHTPLMRAAGQGNLEYAKFLIRNGADQNFKTKYYFLYHQRYNNNMLHLSYTNKNFNIINWLVSNKKANINLTDKDNNTLLIKAARDGNLPIVKNLINHGAKINHQNNSQYTALMYAAQNGHLKTVKFLIKNRVDINLKAGKNITAYNLAKDIKIKKLLLKAGARETVIPDKRFVLLQAAFDGNITKIKKLLNAGYEENLKSPNGQTALIIAVNRGYKKIASLLIKNGAKIDETDKEGDTALLHACKNGNLEMVKLLLKAGARENIHNINYDSCTFIINKSAIVTASQYNNWHIVKYLIKNKSNLYNNKNKLDTLIAALKKHAAHNFCWDEKNYYSQYSPENILLNGNIHYADKNGWTPLMCALANNRYKTAKTLIELGAQVKIKSKIGTSPLMIAVLNADLKSVKLILKHGSNINTQNRLGISALMMAAYQKDFNLVKLLVNSGANINLCDNDNWNALHWLLYEKEERPFCWQAEAKYRLKSYSKIQTSIVKYLLKKGIRINISAQNGVTPLIMAKKENFKKLADFMQKKGARFTKRDKKLLKEILVFDSASTGRIDVIKESMKNKVNLNFKDKFFRTPLIMAIRHGYFKIAKLLLKGGADPNIKTFDGYSALFYDSLTNYQINQIKNKKNSILQYTESYIKDLSLPALLLKQGLDINHKNNLGRNVLMLYCSNWKIDKNYINFLEKNRININAKDKSGRNTLFQLIRYHNIYLDHKILEQLLNSKIDINARDNQGNNILLFLIKRSYGYNDYRNVVPVDSYNDELFNTFKKLLKKGIDINSTDNNDISPLMLAAKYGSIKLTKLLLNNGAQVNIRSKKGTTPLMFAFQEGNYQVMDILAKAGASYADMYYSLGTYNLKIQKYNKAIRYFKKGLKYKKTARLYNNLGVACFKNSLFDKAETNFKKALLSNQKFNLAYYNLACLYAGQNKKSLAMQNLKAAINYGYNNYKYIKKDPDLNNLRDLKEYKKIILKLQNNN